MKKSMFAKKIKKILFLWVHHFIYVFIKIYLIFCHAGQSYSSSRESASSQLSSLHDHFPVCDVFRVIFKL